MKIIYRMSDAGYNKVKPDYINNLNCLRNALRVFPTDKHNWHIIADNYTGDLLDSMPENVVIERVSLGSGAQTFNLALDRALECNDDDIVYFIENDYIHLRGSDDIINEMILGLGSDYATLYLHPDKFLPAQYGGNPEVGEDGGYLTRIYRGVTQIYGLFNSTTMTFAAKISTLRRDESILRKHTTGTYPDDFKMFLELRDNGRSLMCPLNTFSTHGETAWLAPLYKVKQTDLVNEWNKHIYHE